jgi:hypothetical protein
VNPSPAALRIALDARPRQLRVLKCRGGIPPAQPIAFPHADTFSKGPLSNGTLSQANHRGDDAIASVRAPVIRLQPVPGGA